jgi:hypothetical protein
MTRDDAAGTFRGFGGRHVPEPLEQLSDAFEKTDEQPRADGASPTSGARRFDHAMGDGPAHQSVIRCTHGNI